ncbi:type II toxin-antitoxin system VapC family toxin [Rhizobium sp. FY34]|uniref:type II toxin-antitoxin system VapC family toxin n=1 Tax=Rhizobium sp. FY34 TaxID=2562309 RepID=UPI0010BF67C7|nr:type II toxin-antitoxin system VapC family toxin [Rhizobium sp. FY34]
MIAPDLILPECANIFWKKVRRGELTSAEAQFAARLIEGSDMQLAPLLPLFGKSIQLSLLLDHPAYDCTYLALALQERCQFVTADETLVRKLQQSADSDLRQIALSLANAV